MSHGRRVAMIDTGHPRLSLVRQCELVAICRSSYYYRGQGESEFNLRLECIRERLGIADAPLEEPTQPITKRSLIEVLMEKQQEQNDAR